MVNIHIGQFEPVAVVDPGALQQFQRQWRTYRKLIDHDYVFHAEAYAILAATLATRFDRPFAFLDLACGDASQMKETLSKTRVRHYHGVDLSQPALEIAARNLADAPFAVELDHRDFIDAIEDRAEHADVVWFGLSLHHLASPDKLRLMTAIRGVVGDDGIFLMYEPTRPDGESLEAYLERYDRVCRPLWTALSADELEQILTHVRNCDLPETVSGWRDLGHSAGFREVRQLYVAPTDLFRMFLYTV